MLEEVNQRYVEVADKLKDERNIFVIDANQGRDEVFEQVRTILDKEL
jgi:thymidylate kinase